MIGPTQAACGGSFRATTWSFSCRCLQYSRTPLVDDYGEDTGGRKERTVREIARRVLVLVLVVLVRVYLWMSLLASSSSTLPNCHSLVMSLKKVGSE